MGLPSNEGPGQFQLNGIKKDYQYAVMQGKKYIYIKKKSILDESDEPLYFL